LFVANCVTCVYAYTRNCAYRYKKLRYATRGFPYVSCSRIFQSRIFHPLQFGADISSPAFSSLAFSASPAQRVPVALRVVSIVTQRSRRVWRFRGSGSGRLGTEVPHWGPGTEPQWESGAKPPETDDKTDNERQFQLGGWRNNGWCENTPTSTSRKKIIGFARFTQDFWQLRGSRTPACSYATAVTVCKLGLYRNRS